MHKKSYTIVEIINCINMGKLTLDKLNSVELSERLVDTIDALKGGSEEHCHNGHTKGAGGNGGMSWNMARNCGGGFE